MKERQETPRFTPVQWEIMEIVWQRGEAGVGEVWRTLAKRRRVSRNTILTLITRMAEKGWLLPRREGNAFRYTPAFPKEQSQVEEVRRLVDTVFEGSAEGLVMTLLEKGGLSSKESKRIQEMILATRRERRKEKS